MKSTVVAFAALAALSLSGLASSEAAAQAQLAPSPGKTEFIDIRWDGTRRMCVVYPDGHVNFFYQELKNIEKPDDANDRAFYLTLEMNRMAAQGYEFVAMISDEIVMKRVVR